MSRHMTVVRTVFFSLIIVIIITGCIQPLKVGPAIPPTTTPEAVANPEGVVPPVQPPAAPEPTATTAPEVPLLKFVPGGAFLMGSKPKDPDARPDEFPIHQVQMAGFWIYTFEVTNRMYENCVASGKCTEPEKAETGPKSYYGDPKYDKYPVVGVNWAQADLYCKTYDAHLPTEAEWEKAARGFNAMIYPWGNDEPSCDLANFGDCVKDVYKTAQYEKGQSPYEVMDMAGNVREWAQDWYKPDYYATTPIFMPLGPEIGQLKVVRGGGYQDGRGDIRTAARYAYDPKLNFEDVGFRCIPNGKTQAPACLANYHPRCQPTTDRPGDGCEPGNPGTTNIQTKISCPDKGVGTVSVNVPALTGVSVWVDGEAMDCLADPGGEVYSCKGPIPPSGSTATVRVCTYEQWVLNPVFDSLLTLGCESYQMVIPVAAAVSDTFGLASYFIHPAPELMPPSINVVGCPKGYQWSIEDKMCIPDESITEIPEGSEAFCPAGYAFLAEMGCCVPVTTNCPPDLYATLAVPNDCVQVTQNGCPAGFTYDPYLGCIQTPGGMKEIPEGTIACQQGYMYVAGKGCVPIMSQLQVACPEGSIWNSDAQQCVELQLDGCPRGMYLNVQTKECLPLSGPGSGCPPYMMMNPRLNCCVPQPGMDNSDCLPDGEADVAEKPSIFAAGPMPLVDPCPPTPGDCPPGYFMDPEGICRSVTGGGLCPPGTVGTPNDPNLCLPEGGGDCPEGMRQDPFTGGCYMPDGLIQCGPYQYFDYTLGFCVDINGDCCAQGYFYDFKLQTCLPYSTNLVDDCPPGYHLEGDECLPDLLGSLAGTCYTFNLNVPQCIQCAEGFVLNSAGNCVCPDGYVLSDAGRCIRKPSGCVSPSPATCRALLKPDQCAAACCRWDANSKPNCVPR